VRSSDKLAFLFLIWRKMVKTWPSSITVLRPTNSRDILNLPLSNSRIAANKQTGGNILALFNMDSSSFYKPAGPLKTLPVDLSMKMDLA
jgi:hypothetical protein